MIYSFIAMAPAGGGGAQGGSSLLTFLPMLVIILIMYFLILRPQAKRQKQHTEMLKAAGKGDKIVTTGGIHAQILKVNEKENTLFVKASDNMKFEIDRTAIARKISDNVEAIKPK